MKAGATVATSPASSADAEPREGLLAILDTACGDGAGGDGSTERVYAAGGDGPGHAFSRCLGDPAAKKLGITAAAAVVEYQVRDHDEWVVVASDGVWAHLTPDDVAATCAGESDAVVVAHKIVAKCAEAQIDAAPQRRDDVTCVVAFLHGVRKGKKKPADGGAA